MKKTENIRILLLLLLVVLLTGSMTRVDAQVTFKASAPASVVEGEQFRLSYVLNREGRELRLPDITGFDLLFGPSTSTSYSQQTINGKTTSESSVTYTYILMAKKAGTYTLPPASITVDGSNYKSNTLQIKVLPPDEASTKTPTAPGNKAEDRASTGSGTATVSSGDAFIRPSSPKTAFTNRKDSLSHFVCIPHSMWSIMARFSFRNLRDSWWRRWMFP